ncbi:NAD(P)/FAD-dependent oxidoreductase [Vallitalea okinawensis]|uniref:NAD(P)/FAD-dependent oxidoreductase n=1 Tax=Vallitalea okinawensis TaxID=2078660 RepID=UPI000CFDEDE2|nr:NAD(P)/FAD-dependent oxidoreductase [Vallitalea okinawensis]
MYDVAIIGAGVIGTLTARLLSLYDLQVCIIEKDGDVAMGTTKANSAIIHAGYDAKPGSLKAKLNVKGNAMMEQVAKDLAVHFKRIGSFVVAFNDEEMARVKELYQRGLDNGVPEMKIINGNEVREMEPNLSEDIIGALYAPTAGIIGPYELTVAAAEVAVRNGVELKLEHEVESISEEEDGYRIQTNQDSIQTKVVINAAGIFADAIAEMVGDHSFEVHARKGEYMLLDKSQGNTVSRVIFQPPSKVGKGILVTPTVDGNLLVGPTADESQKEDLATTQKGLEKVLRGAKRSVPSFNEREVIRSFAGLRAVGSTGDFVIEEADGLKGFYHAAGIESPGLSAAPAIAEELLRKIGDVIELNKVENLNLLRKPFKRFSELTNEERRELIKKDPRYGKIVCRCEKVTEGEIIECIHRPAGATNLDAVKRRTRAGMGRCQGGFCSPRVVDLLAKELDLPMEEVTKQGSGSYLLVGKTK